MSQAPHQHPRRPAQPPLHAPCPSPMNAPTGHSGVHQTIFQGCFKRGGRRAPPLALPMAAAVRRKRRTAQPPWTARQGRRRRKTHLDDLQDALLIGCQAHGSLHDLAHGLHALGGGLRGAGAETCAVPAREQGPPPARGSIAAQNHPHVLVQCEPSAAWSRRGPCWGPRRSQKRASWRVCAAGVQLEQALTGGRALRE